MIFERAMRCLGPLHSQGASAVELDELMPVAKQRVLAFNEAAHRYTFNCMTQASVPERLESVSVIVHHLFEPFNARQMASNVVSWQGNNVNSDYYQKTVEQVLAEWDYARNYGTKVHELIELYNKLGERPCEEDRQTPQYQQFLACMDFQRDNPHLRFVHNEFRVYIAGLGYVGTIDTIARDSNGKCWRIMDYKCVKMLRKSGKECAHPFLKGYRECNYHQYSLQLSLYKFFCIHAYGFSKFGECDLIHLPPRAKTYAVVPILNMDHVVEIIVQDRMNGRALWTSNAVGASNKRKIGDAEMPQLLVDLCKLSEKKSISKRLNGNSRKIVLIQGDSHCAITLLEKEISVECSGRSNPLLFVIGDENVVYGFVKNFFSTY